MKIYDIINEDANNNPKKGVAESTSVTDYNPKSQGGTRKELLAKYHKTKDPKDAEAARKAGATQKELQGVAEGHLGNMLSWPEVVNKVNSAMKATGWKGQRKDDDSYMFSTAGRLDDEDYFVIISNVGKGYFEYALGTVEEGDPRIGEKEFLPMTLASVSELMDAIRDGFGLNEGEYDDPRWEPREPDMSRKVDWDIEAERNRPEEPESDMVVYIIDNETNKIVLKFRSTGEYWGDIKHAAKHGYDEDDERYDIKWKRKKIEETATAGSTSAGNVAVGAIYKNKPAKQAKNKDGTAKNALDMKANLLTGGSIKR